MLLMRGLGIIAFGAAVFGISYHYNKKFLDWLRFQSLGTRDYIVERLNMMFIDIPSHQILLGLFAIMVTVVGWKSPKPVVDWMYRRRVSKMVFQMVDGLSLMSNGLKSGLSVVQSLGLVAQEMPNPIRQEFGLILSENKLGVSIEDAFLNLSRRVRSDDVEMFVTSVNILKETGGNLAETFDTIVTTIRDRIKVEKKIEAMTAQGLYQGIFVMCIPPILGVVFYQTDPEFMRPLFNTPIGWVIILAIIVLEAIGFFVIMKVIKIDV